MALPTLRTERLDVRPWSPDDVAAFHAIWGDPEVIWWGEMEDLAASADLLEQRVDIGPGIGWGAAVLRTTGEIVGNATMQPCPGDRTDIEIGWHLARAHWGHGYATEWGRALVEHAFTTVGLSRVVADIAPHNARSQGVARRLGMTPQGQVERASGTHDVWVLDRS